MVQRMLELKAGKNWGRRQAKEVVVSTGRWVLQFGGLAEN
jgi:hypothetical protein